jgi:hypothetical protein
MNDRAEDERLARVVTNMTVGFKGHFLEIDSFGR